MVPRNETTIPGGKRIAEDHWWTTTMATAMDELDLAIFAPTDSPPWQPLASETVLRMESGPRLKPADVTWNEIAHELEQNLVWAEVVALLEVSEATRLLRS